MSDPDQPKPGFPPNPAAVPDDAFLDALFAQARATPTPPLSPAFMHRLRQDAQDAHLVRSIPPKVTRPGWPRLAGFWASLQDLFGGKPGLAGASLACCVAFAFGILSPDAVSDIIGLSGTYDLAALNIAVAPDVLWTEE